MSRQHSELGASKAERWMACPGSVDAERGLPDQRSEYAIEGTAAHTLAEKALRKGLDAAVWLDTEIIVDEGTPDESTVTVTDDMVEAVQVYLDYVRKRRAFFNYGRVQAFIEEQFDLSALNPPEPMFGTADYVLWHDDEKFLEVVDYKHGQGVVVEAADNPQFMYYALGAVVALKKKPNKFRVTVVQPRAPHAAGVIRSYDFDWDALYAFKKHLFERAQATQAENAPRAAGDWCRFCKAAATCPEQRRVAIEVAQSEFDADDNFLPADPSSLTDAQIGLVLSKANIVEDWFKAIRNYVSERIRGGEEVPGWKLVPKRPSRKWKDEDNTANVLSGAGLLVEDDDLYIRKLVSPAQAEARLKELKIKYDLSRLVIKQSSGTNLVPAEDPRPALPTVLDEFEADLPDTSSKSKGKARRSAKTQ